eukprot:10521028-Karenia_brevis.AAC.1
MDGWMALHSASLPPRYPPAGLDQCMPSQQNFDVMRSVEAGEVSEERVTDAATRIVKQMVR